MKQVSIAVVSFLLGMGFYWAFITPGVSTAPSAPEDEDIPVNGEAPVSENGEDQTPDQPQERTMDEEDSDTPQPTVDREEYTISVNDQTPGDRALIATIKTPVTVWVGIHDERDGKPWAVLGARRFREGEYTNEHIRLFLEPLKAGNTYYAVFLQDDGDDTFDYTKDTPLLDKSGKPIMASFTVSNL